MKLKDPFVKIKEATKFVLGEHFFYKLRDIRDSLSPAEKQMTLKRKLFFQEFVKKDDLCFDVGANFGNRIIPLLQIGAKVLAVEPQESCYKYLRSKFKNKIIIIPKGLCDQEGIRKFHISKTTVISSFSDEWIDAVKKNRFKDYEWEKTIDIEMTTLDNLITEYGTPGFIKIDVEGYELEVLKGLSKPIRMISFEYTVPEQTEKIVDCIKTIEKNSKDILCNYSIRETMEWAHSQWFTVSEFLNNIKTPEFSETGFGDIYVKLKSS